MKLSRAFFLLRVNLKYVVNKLRYKHHNYSSNSITCIVFSRNRALQLDALLRSIEKYSESSFDVYVQYSCSPNHSQSYENLILKYGNALKYKFVREDSFSVSLLDIIKGVKTQFLFFLVDDQVFVRPFNMNKIISVMKDKTFFSLRLGKSITDFGIFERKLFPKYNILPDYLRWSWKQNKDQKDWGYQFSVDGTVYKTMDVLCASMSIPFRAPNSFEDNMNSVWLFRSDNVGMSYHEPVVINLIINASRQEKAYEHFESGEYSPDDMLELWNVGKRFSIEKVSSIVFHSTHFILKDINSILE